MSKVDILLLCTSSLYKKSEMTGALNGCVVDVIPFITTEPIEPVFSNDEISTLASKQINVVFTSSVAANIVGKLFKDRRVNWNFFCVGEKTAQTVTKYFSNHQIHTREDASALAESIISATKVSEVLFFCGDKRLDTLPLELRSNGIVVSEKIVYRTILTPIKIEKKYDGVIFLSPSAVDSFFLENQPTSDTTYFALGNTTRSCILKHNINVEHVVTSVEHDSGKLMEQAVEYFKRTHDKNND